MSFIDGLLTVCDKYMNESWYVGGAIPKKKLNRVMTEFPIPVGEEIIAVLDCTVFGSCKYGLALGTKGVYSNNDWTTTRRQGAISWDEFAHANILPHQKYEVDISANVIVNISGSRMNQEQLVDLLKNIQHYIISWFKNTPPVPTPQQSDVEWLLAIEGKQYGPYSVEMIKEMISSGQVKQEVTYGWKLGMDQWLFLSDIDEFKQQSAPPTPPPLPDMATIGQKPASNPIPIQKVELNTASIEDLLALPGIDLSMAKRFTDERTKRNGFSSFTEVRELLNLQPHLFEEIRKSTLLKPIASNISGNGRMIDF
ncbi:helix-hairpin-helix domain-containing protein [Bacillus sp. B15-48]|uniref:GYF domain-containing protein n=1 Tax=Bacillus sp. B15-48 TaxID=1548601 RepID=UPI00193FF019|nr:DUF4339 domain-containing protein [Bacillus sp. B15-48]